MSIKRAPIKTKKQPDTPRQAMEEVDPSLLPAAVPTPGSYYQIKKGDNLLGIAGKAYAVKAGTKARLDFARKINRHPLNRKYLQPEKADNLFPEGVLTFLPSFSCDAQEQIVALQTTVAGNCFAVLWIPDAVDEEDPLMGRGIDIPSGLLSVLLAARAEGETQVSQSARKQSRMKRASQANAVQTKQLSMVLKADVTPLRFICSVMQIFKYPNHPGVLLVYGPASGILIGNRHVLTAAHVVDRVELGRVLENPVLIVTPGDESLFKDSGPPPELNLDEELPFAGLGASLFGKSPLGGFVSTTVNFPKNHKTPTQAIIDAGTRHLFDYAVITLPKSVGQMKWNNTRFGYWGSPTHGDGTRFLPQTNRDDLQGKTVYVSGYPFTEARVAQHGITQWISNGLVANDALRKNAELGKGGHVKDNRNQREPGRERLGYMIPTEGGHSGSPVWRGIFSSNQVFRDMVAVHSDGGYELSTAASGVLLTETVIDEIKGWMQQT